MKYSSQFHLLLVAPCRAAANAAANEVLIVALILEETVGHYLLDFRHAVNHM